MSKALCDLSGGELGASPLAAILIETLRIRVSGELLIEAKGGISRVYVRNGQPCGAEVFFGFKPLGQFLLEHGWIDIQALERSLMAVADGRKQGEALVSLGCLTQEQLEQGLALHHLGLLRNLAQLSEGFYRFNPTVDLPPWTREIRISAHRAIVDSLAAPSAAPTCRRILRAVPPSSRLLLRRGWERYVGYFRLDESEAHFLSRLTEPKLLSEILSLRGLDPSRASALTAALYLMGVLASPDRSPDVPLTHTPIPNVTPGPPTPGPVTMTTVTGVREPERTVTPLPPAEEDADARDRRMRMIRRAVRSIGEPMGKRSSGALRAPPEDPEGFTHWVQETWRRLPSLSPAEKLGLEEDASDEDLKKAYVRAAKRLHPDRIPPSLDHLRDEIRRIFVAISEAYELLRRERRGQDRFPTGRK